MEYLTSPYTEFGVADDGDRLQVDFEEWTIDLRTIKNLAKGLREALLNRFLGQRTSPGLQACEQELATFLAYRRALNPRKRVRVPDELEFGIDCEKQKAAGINICVSLEFYM